MKVLTKGDVVLEKVLIRYASIEKPDGSAFGKGQYAVTAFIPKEDNQATELKKFIINIIAKEKIKITDKKNNPLQDGDKKFNNSVENYEVSGLPEDEIEVKKEKIECYKNNFMLKCSNKKQPAIVNKFGKPLNPENIGFEEAIVNLHLSSWVYKKENQGIKFFLNSIMLIKEGTSFNSASSVDEAFGTYYEKEPELKKSESDDLDYHMGKGFDRDMDSIF